MNINYSKNIPTHSIQSSETELLDREKKFLTDINENTKEINKLARELKDARKDLSVIKENISTLMKISEDKIDHFFDVKQDIYNLEIIRNKLTNLIESRKLLIESYDSSLDFKKDEGILVIRQWLTVVNKCEKDVLSFENLLVDIKKAKSLLKEIDFNLINISIEKDETLQEKSFLTSSKKISPEELQLMIAICIENNQYNHIASLISQCTSYQTKHGYDGIQFHYLLDKVKVEQKDELEGGFQKVQTLVLAEALNKVLIDLNNDENLSEEDLFLKAQCKTLIKSLGLSSFFDLNRREICYKSLILRELSSLKNQKIDFPLLVPLSTKTGIKNSSNHAISLSFEALDSDTCRVILYNTGFKLNQHHPQLEGSNKYQTHLILDIPFEKLLDSKNLEKIFDKENPNIDEVYDWFKKDLIDLGGKLHEPSKDPEDYNQPQMSGTCSAQVQNAFVRYQIRNKAPGTSQAKTGLVKLLKARTLKEVGLKNLDKTGEKIKQHVETKMSEYDSTVALYEITKDDKAFKPLKDELYEMANYFQLGDLDRFPTKTGAERYYFLKYCASKIALKSPKLLNSIQEGVEMDDGMKKLFSHTLVIQKKEHNKIKKSQVTTLEHVQNIYSATKDHWINVAKTYPKTSILLLVYGVLGWGYVGYKSFF